MKATGIVRQIDHMGRVVLPIELRRNFLIEEHDPIEIYTDGDKIVLKKYSLTCYICGFPSGDIIKFKGKAVCSACIIEMSK